MAKKATKAATPATKAATPDLFAMAEGSAPAPAKKSSKAKAKDEIDLGEDLEKLGAIKTFIKKLEGVAAAFEGELRQTVREKFVEQMLQTKMPPKSFVGCHGVTTASCEIRRKGSNVPLSADAVEVLTAQGVTTDEVVIVPKRYVFNPEALAQTEVRTRLSEVIANDPILSQAAIIQFQPEEKRHVTSEATLSDIARLVDDRAVMSDLLSQVSTIAVGKFQSDDNTIKGALAKITSMLEELD